MRNRRLDLWLPSYMLQIPHRFWGGLDGRVALTHIIFLVCDHFEPRHGIKRETQPQERLQPGAGSMHVCRNVAALNLTRYQNTPGSIRHTMARSTWQVSLTWCLPASVKWSSITTTTVTMRSLRRDLRTAIAEYHRWGSLLESSGNAAHRLRIYPR